MTDDDEFVPLNVTVTLTDLEWAAMLGLVGAVLKLHAVGVDLGQDSALRLISRVEDIEHGYFVIQQAVMDATVNDVVEHLNAHLEEEPDK
jgi:hypothetical protein